MNSGKLKSFYANVVSNIRKPTYAVLEWGVTQHTVYSRLRPYPQSGNGPVSGRFSRAAGVSLPRCRLNRLKGQRIAERQMRDVTFEELIHGGAFLQVAR